MKTDVKKELEEYVSALDKRIKAAKGPAWEVDKVEVILRIRASEPGGKFVDLNLDTTNPKIPRPIILTTIENPGKPFERAYTRRPTGTKPGDGRDLVPGVPAPPPAPPPNRAQRRAKTKRA